MGQRHHTQFSDLVFAVPSIYYTAMQEPKGIDLGINITVKRVEYINISLRLTMKLSYEADTYVLL